MANRIQKAREAYEKAKSDLEAEMDSLRYWQEHPDPELTAEDNQTMLRSIRREAAEKSAMIRYRGEMLASPNAIDRIE